MNGIALRVGALIRTIILVERMAMAHRHEIASKAWHTPHKATCGLLLVY